MTPSNVITSVRTIIQDEDSVAYRYSDTKLLEYVNQALDRIALVRPDLFTAVVEIACTAGTTIQQTPSYARIMEVFQVKDGNAVTEVNRETIDQMAPSWRTDAAGACVNWIRDTRTPNMFFIYPQAPAAQTLIAQVSAAPAEYTSAQTIAMSDVYKPVVVDMVVYLIESGDNEHTLTQRAYGFYQRAMDALGITIKNKSVLDSETGGNDPAQVI